MAKKKSKYPRLVPFTVEETTELMGAGCSYDEEDNEATITIDNYFVCITKSEVDKGVFTYYTRVEKDYEPIDEDKAVAYSIFEVLINDLNEPYNDMGHFQFISE